MNNSFRKSTVVRFVAEDYRAAQIFEYFGVNLGCCSRPGKGDACSRNGRITESVKDHLTTFNADESNPYNYNSISLDSLINHTVNNHHRSVRKKLPDIEFRAKKVIEVYGMHEEEISDILYEFLILREKISNHLEIEEQVLFPHIRQLIKWKNDRQKQVEGLFYRTVANSIRRLKQDHANIKDIFAKIQKLITDFFPTNETCITHHILFKNLKELEKIMLRQVQLEDGTLFPRALALEKKLN
ncbi:MAG TPA: hemerythrin domain-containing protein [Balneolaceae bacterium]|nr:hemerythrin domain-containing protein [Balneolaceae bacterium]